MIRTRVFQSEISTESVCSLIEELEPLLEDGDCVKLYFTSPGGSVPAADIFQGFLEDWEESIILVAFHEIYSCGFDIFYKYQGERVVMDLTVGMLHEASADLGMAKLKNPNTPHSIVKQQVELFNQSELDKIREKLTNAEIKRYSEGDDVFFTTERLKEICNL